MNQREQVAVNLKSYFHLVRRSRIMELYLHSPICLQGMVLNNIIKYENNFLQGIHPVVRLSHIYKNNFVGFEVVTPVVMESTIFRDS
jgi:hypothetical protein